MVRGELGELLLGTARSLAPCQKRVFSSNARKRKGIAPVRGTRDIFDDIKPLYDGITEIARFRSKLYGFSEVAFPIMEHAEVFTRTLGESSDVVTKEMYSFMDQSNNTLCLRPEGTAGAMRAVIHGGRAFSMPQKMFYSGPMFRYERPQRGRARQFHQFGVEYLGRQQPEADAEVIALAHDVLLSLGLERAPTLQINTLGDEQSREAYRSVLLEFFERHRDNLSATSRTRLERGSVLRILDSKERCDAELVAAAPSLHHHLSNDSRRRFDVVLEGLTASGVPFRLNPRLVRGLDYYSDTAFEFVVEEEEGGGGSGKGEDVSKGAGAAGTVLAGGRYDGLAQTLGGPHIPAIGWAAGVERLVLLLSKPTSDRLVADSRPRSVAVVTVGGGGGRRDETAPTAAAKALSAASTDIAMRCRDRGVVVHSIHENGPLKKSMKAAHACGAQVVVLVGEDELAAGEVTLRLMESGDQRRVALHQVVDTLLEEGVVDCLSG